MVYRFYLYHSLNSVLQFEDLPKKVILLPDNQFKEVKDYAALEPVITIVWMVHDNLNESKDYSGYTVVSESVPDFLRNARLWDSLDVQELRRMREDLLLQVNNNTKSLLWFQENRLIYAFQQNIVANPKFSKYKRWFEFAEKTLKRINDRFAYQEFEKDEVFRNIIRRLKLEVENPDEIKYIRDYQEYIEKIQRYDDGMKREGYTEAENLLLPILEEKERALEEKERALKEKET